MSGSWLTEQRFKVIIPSIEDWFPSLDTLAEISVINLQNRTTVKRLIPAVYLFHLRWIIRGATPNAELDDTHAQRSNWLHAVLDAFAEELRANEDTSDWRSKVLNPILVRAFYGADDFDVQSIAKQMKANRQLEGRITERHWEGFYHNHDVIAPINQKRWLRVKGAEPVEASVVNECEGDPIQKAI